MTLESERRNSQNPNLILNRLLSGRLYPSQAAMALNRFFKGEGISSEEAVERIRYQHLFFQEGNLDLTQIQKVSWDDTVICLESLLDIPEEKKISKNRLVAIGTPSYDPEFRDLAF